MPADAPEDALSKLDNHLCELKELQIRDGLHVFGQAPAGDQLTDLLMALVRVPRVSGEGGDASLLRALAADLGLAGFDPLDCSMAEAMGRPEASCFAGRGRGCLALQWRHRRAARAAGAPV